MKTRDCLLCAHSGTRGAVYFGHWNRKSVARIRPHEGFYNCEITGFFVFYFCLIYLLEEQVIFQN